MSCVNLPYQVSFNEMENLNWRKFQIRKRSNLQNKRKNSLLLILRYQIDFTKINKHKRQGKK